MCAGGYVALACLSGNVPKWLPAHQHLEYPVRNHARATAPVSITTSSFLPVQHMRS